MKPVSIVLCSPRKGGSTDKMAAMFSAALQSAGCAAREIALRDYPIRPCSGCGCCSSPPWACALDEKDDANAIFSLILDSSLAVFASPIYFYALPAHFKALIDRSQKFWRRLEAVGEEKQPLPAIAILAAGRMKGPELFSGALRCLRWFGRAINLRFQDDLAFRGVDSPTDLAAQPQIEAAIEEAARKWAGYLGSARVE